MRKNWQKHGDIHEDKAISQLLKTDFSRTRAAPTAAAGVAYRTSDTWQLAGGATQRAGLSQVFDLASITKSFFALLVLDLVSEGIIQWDAQLQSYLPDTQGSWAGAQTIEALLSHRAGLRPHLKLFQYNWNGAPHYLPTLIEQMAKAQGQHDPEKAVYSDLGYILTGLAIESETGESLDEALQRRVLHPLNIAAGSSRSWSASLAEFRNIVVPTEVQSARGGLLRGVVHDDNAWSLRGTKLCGHAGLFGSVQGLLHLGCFLLDAINERPGPLTREQLAPLVKKRPGGTLRMGFDGISGTTSLAGGSAGPLTFGHLGFTGTSFWCDPLADRVTVLLTNRVNPSRNNPRLAPLRPKIHDFLWTY